MGWNNNYNNYNNGNGNNWSKGNGRGGNGNNGGWNNNRGNGGGNSRNYGGNNNKFHKRQTSSSVRNSGEFINHGHGSIGESKLRSDNPNAPTLAGIVKVDIDMVAGGKYWLNCWEKVDPDTGKPYLSFVIGNAVDDDGRDEEPAAKKQTPKAPPKTLFNDKFKNKAKPTTPQVEEEAEDEDTEEDKIDY